MANPEASVRELLELQRRKRELQLEEATAIKKALDGMTAVELAERLGVSRTILYNRMALLELAGSVRTAWLAGDIDTEVATAMAGRPVSLLPKVRGLAAREALRLIRQSR